MAHVPTRRQALYFPGEMLEEIQKESTRQDRPISWLIQQAWRLSRAELRAMPGTTDYIPQLEYNSKPSDPGRDPEQ